MSPFVLRPGLAALVLLTAAVAAAPAVEPRWPMPAWLRATPAEAGMDAAQLDKARRYALRGGGSGYVTRGGRLVMQWGDPRRRYDLKSTTKSIGITALGLALGDGKIKSLSDLAARYHPSLANPPAGNASTGWPPRITLFHLATLRAFRSGWRSVTVVPAGTSRKIARAPSRSMRRRRPPTRASTLLPIQSYSRTATSHARDGVTERTPSFG